MRLDRRQALLEKVGARLAEMHAMQLRDETLYKQLTDQAANQPAREPAITPDAVRAVAARLTTRARTALEGQGVWVDMDGRVARSLVRLGLCTRERASLYRLTPNGLAVRELLYPTAQVLEGEVSDVG